MNQWSITNGDAPKVVMHRWKEHQWGLGAHHVCLWQGGCHKHWTQGMPEGSGQTPQSSGSTCGCSGSLGGFLFWESFKCTLNMNYLPKISKVSGSTPGISGDHFTWCLRQQLWKILFAWGQFCCRPIYFNILSIYCKCRSPVENLRQSFASFWGSLIPKWQKNWKLCWKGERETWMWWNRIFWKHKSDKLFNRWAEGEFSKDSQYSLIPSLYTNLKWVKTFQLVAKASNISPII